MAIYEMYACLVLICNVGLVVCPPPTCNVPKELSKFLKTEATFLSVLEFEMLTLHKTPKPISCETTAPTETKVAYLVLMHCLVNLALIDSEHNYADAYFYVQVLEDKSASGKGSSLKKSLTATTSINCCSRYVIFFIGKLQCPLYDIHLLLCSKLNQKWDEFIEGPSSNEDRQKAIKRYVTGVCPERNKALACMNCTTISLTVFQYRYSYREMNLSSNKDERIMKQIKEDTKIEKKKSLQFYEISILQSLEENGNYRDCDVGNLRLRVFSVLTTEAVNINGKKSNKAVKDCFGAYFTGILLGTDNPVEIVEHSRRANVQMPKLITLPIHTVILPKWESVDNSDNELSEVTIRLKQKLKVNLRSPNDLKMELVASAHVPFAFTRIQQLRLFVGRFVGESADGKSLEGFFYASSRRFSDSEAYIRVEQVFFSHNGNIQNAFATANYFANDILEWPTDAQDLITFEPDNIKRVSQPTESTTETVNLLGNTEINTKFFKIALESVYKMTSVEFLSFLPCEDEIFNDDSRFGLSDNVRNSRTVRIAKVRYSVGSGGIENKYLVMLINSTTGNRDRVIAIGYLSMSALSIKMIRKSLLFADPAYASKPANHLVWIADPCKYKTPLATILKNNIDSDNDLLKRTLRCGVNCLKFVSFGYPTRPVNGGFEIVVVEAHFPISKNNSYIQYLYMRLTGVSFPSVCMYDQLYDKIDIAQDMAVRVFNMQIIDTATVKV